MAFKYKLKEVAPMDIEKAADTVGSDVMKGIAAKHLNGKDFEDLEQILGQAGIEQDKINKILDMWAERPLFVNPNEGKQDPLDVKMQDLLARFKKEDEESGEYIPDPNAKNTFKNKLKEAITKRIKKERGTSRS
jgi:hypothetical protein